MRQDTRPSLSRSTTSCDATPGYASGSEQGGEASVTEKGPGGPILSVRSTNMSSITPASQVWKRERVAALGISPPSSPRHPGGCSPTMACSPHARASAPRSSRHHQRVQGLLGQSFRPRCANVGTPNALRLTGVHAVHARVHA
jgi:hypothetical protein